MDLISFKQERISLTKEGSIPSFLAETTKRLLKIFQQPFLCLKINPEFILLYFRFFHNLVHDIIDKFHMHINSIITYNIFHTAVAVMTWGY